MIVLELGGSPVASAAAIGPGGGAAVIVLIDLGGSPVASAAAVGRAAALP